MAINFMRSVCLAIVTFTFLMLLSTSSASAETLAGEWRGDNGDVWTGAIFEPWGAPTQEGVQLYKVTLRYPALLSSIYFTLLVMAVLVA